ncbi:DL-endopeptidase inhibitor IseA family protein [Paenibacillus tuaregi]|uniref:DL-endopeptidase inhibitor IseA family protein n=1 Tax=Paenibacillus tuaregi TaxID=1816681 RepID=UPI000837EB0D|nr:DL-endopeptidase inhibitor IseA family protein [Paenibacillus tuaregi]
MRKAVLLFVIAAVILTACRSGQKQGVGTDSRSQESVHMTVPRSTTGNDLSEGEAEAKPDQKAPQIKKPRASDILQIRRKAEKLRNDIFVSSSAWDCNKNNEPKIAVPSADNGQFDIMFMCTPYDTKEKILNYLSKAVTKRYAETMIRDHVESGLMAEVNGKMGVAPFEGVDTLNWDKSKVVELHTEDNQAEAVIQVWDEADQVYDRYRAIYLYEDGWKENSLESASS